MQDVSNAEQTAVDPGLVAFRRRVARWLFRAAALMVLLWSWLGFVGSSDGQSNDLGMLPSFSLPTLQGETLEGASLEGQVTVVNFWASWCPPCRSEAPVLAAVAADTSGSGVTFLGVLHQDRREPALAFAEEHGLHFPTVVDDGRLARSFGVRSIPMTFVVGADGRILARHFGPIQDARLRVLIADAQAVAAAAPIEER